MEEDYKDRLNQAFEAIRREEFLLVEVRKHAEEDRPLSIGYSQTNSQPSTVRKMLEWLHVEDGDKILDVGSGSGWTAALLSYLAGGTGSVDAVETVPELVEFGRKNCERLLMRNVSFHKAGDVFGWPHNAPYDKILVSASADKLPLELVNQLKPGSSGKMVIPVQDEILEVSRNEQGDAFVIRHPGFLFVPLINTSNPTL